MNPLTQRELDQMHCGMPGCDHTSHDGLYFHGRCHLDSPVAAMYQNGVITITCATCKSLIAKVAVRE